MIDVIFEFKELYGFFVETKLKSIPRKGERVCLSDSLLQNQIEGDFVVLKVNHIVFDIPEKSYVDILLMKL